MKKTITIFLTLGLLNSFSNLCLAQKKKVRTNSGSLSQVQQLIDQDQYDEALISLYRLTANKEIDQQQIKYLLGTTLLSEGYSHLASIQFVDIIRSGNSKYFKASLDKLLIAAGQSGDDSLLNYALNKLDRNQIASAKSDLLFFQMGQKAQQDKDFNEAISVYNQVPDQSPFYFDAQYQVAITYLEMKKSDLAIKIASNLFSKAKNQNDRQIITLLLARSYYQRQDWDNSIRYYKAIPRDSIYWSDTLFELSWAQLRAARFRSVLGTLQTLHSVFYENEYHPETLVVRGIVYLYICRFDELEKNIQIFETQYGSYANQMNRFYKNNSNSNEAYSNEILAAESVRKNKQSKTITKIPYPILRMILKEGDIQRNLKAQEKIKNELIRIDQNRILRQSNSFTNYTRRILNARQKSIKKHLGELTKIHLERRISEWSSLEEQVSYLKFEMINSRKEAIKQKISGKLDTDLSIDKDKTRDFYVENGFEYWPVDSEVWADELGNFFYMGSQQCQ